MSNSRKIAGYGWRPDLPDHRDRQFAVSHKALANLPASVDLRSGMPAVYDQGQIGSCTANAIAGAFEFDLRKQGAPDFMPSRLFIYYNERAKEGSVGYDSGAQIRDGVKSVAKLGVCPEPEWPYDGTPADPETGKFPASSRAGQRPSEQCYTDAKRNEAVVYERAPQALYKLKATLASGFPVVFGFSVYSSFESDEVAATGVVPLPRPGEEQIGGHAVVLAGYDDASQRFLVRNSWGSGWGQGGYFTMPYAYVTDAQLASDFWVVHKVS